MDIHFLFFENYETLDIFGPIEVFSSVEGAKLSYISLNGGPVKSRQGHEIITEPASSLKPGGVLVVPGGMGTRTLVQDEAFLSALKALCDQSEFVLSICTGSGLLAKCGALDHRRATSNKQAFDWAKTTSDRVTWVKQARWVADGKFYTSSGVSAGIDMALGFVCDRLGEAQAHGIARSMEYLWNSDNTEDAFCL